MATNPSIILSGNNFNDVYNDQRAKIAQVQAEQQAAKLQNLQVAQAQQSFDDEQNFRKAFIQANGDAALTVATAAKLGVGPARIQTFLKSQADLQKTLLDNHKTQADTDKTNLEKMDLKNSEIHGALQPVIDAKPEEFETAKTFTINNLVKRGVLTDDEAKQAAGMDKNALAMFNAGLLNVKQNSDLVRGEAATSQAKSAATQADKSVEKQADDHAKFLTEQAEKGKVDAANNLSLGLASGGLVGYGKALEGITDPQIKSQFKTPQQIALMSPPDAKAYLDDASMTGHERVQLQQAKEAQAQLAKFHGDETAISLGNLKVAQANSAIAARREARQESSAGMAGPDGKPSDAAYAAAYGSLDPLTIRAMLRKNPGFISQIKKVDPDFDEAKIEDRYNTLRELTNTSANKPGGRLIAANTLIQHADLLRQSIAAMNNGSFTPGNALYNKVAEMFGAPEPNVASLVSDFVSSEGAKTAVGGAPQRAELDRLHQGLDRDKSPQALNAALDAIVKLGAGGLHSIKELRDNANINNSVIKIVGSDTAEALRRVGIDPDTLKAKAAQPAQAPKVATMDHLRQYAKENNMSVDQAAVEARKAGYAVQ